MSEQTLVVLLSDHGEEFQEHGSVLHKKLYTRVTRIPLILKVPGGPAGIRVDAVVESIARPSQQQHSAFGGR